MSQATKAREQDRKARARARVLFHCEQVTLCIWRDRHRQDVERDAKSLLVQSVPVAELLSQKSGRVGRDARPWFSPK
jgi:hypothetical protein